MRDVPFNEFFASLEGLPSDEAVLACESAMAGWKADLEALKQQYQSIPRGDKVAAHEMRMRIERVQTNLRKVRSVAAGFRAAVERKESHYLWVNAVREVCGPDALQQCFDWMRAERQRRRAER